MPYIKVDRDTVLDKVYECRSKIDFTNSEALKAISELVDIIIHAPQNESQANLPRIRIGR
jgi:hypothetical protein